MKLKDKKPRIPREKGITELCYFYQNAHPSQKPQILQNIKNYIIKSYILNSFTINNKQCSIPTLALYLSTPLSILQKQIQQNSLNLHTLIDPENLQDSLTNLLSLSATWALEDRGKALQQYQTMASSQGGTYKPFISSEVSRSLETLLKSNAQFSSLILSYKNTKNTNNIVISNTTNNQDNSNTLYLDTKQALELIQHQPNYMPLKESLKHSKEAQESLYNQYTIGCPNLDPNSDPGEPPSHIAHEPGSLIATAIPIPHESRREAQIGALDDDNI